MRLQYFQFPLKVNYLRIQNCDTVYLEAICQDDQMTYFSHLHIFNVTRLLLRRDSSIVFIIHEKITTFSIWDLEKRKDERKKFTAIPIESDDSNFSLISVTFESILINYFTDSLDTFSLSQCERNNQNHEFEYFKISKSRVHGMNKNFLSIFAASKIFFMNTVFFASWPVNSFFKNGTTVFIANCIFDSSIEANSFQGNISKVLKYF